MAVDDITVRREPADSDTALRLIARYEEELDGRFPGGFEVNSPGTTQASELTPPNGSFLVAFLSGSPAGCGAVRKLDDAVAEVKRMWVDPTSRGRGIGTRLLRELESEAEHLGSTVVRLDTSAHLPEALRLYRSHGYVEIAMYNANPYATHWFEKRLTQ